MTTNPIIPKEDLAHMLRRKILIYKQARQNLSSQQIAKKFGMSSSTFSRIENLDIKAPTFDQVIKILTGTGHHKELQSYLKNHYPEIARLYTEGFLENDHTNYVSDKISEYMKNPRTSRLMIISFSVSGLKKSVVKEEFGNEGVRTLEMLIERGVLTSEDGEVYRPLDVGTAVSLSCTKALVNRALNDYYDLKGYENKTACNYLTFQSESIDLERVYPMIIGLLAELRKNVKEIFNNPDNHGDETVFVSLISDSLIKNNLGKKFSEGIIK
jgi:transcriptional regulator with XRE-family HTH domain